MKVDWATAICTTLNVTPQELVTLGQRVDLLQKTKCLTSGRKMIRFKVSPKMAKYLKDHPYMEPDGLQEEQLEEKFSKEERKKRAKKCDNPKGFTMKQFCKNQKTRSKKGERTNEGKDPKKGTGKKPKGSGRRLYTDENPKDTVSVKFPSHDLR